jgi:transcriptional activator of glycolytic enzymes GCR1
MLHAAVVAPINFGAGVTPPTLSAMPATASTTPPSLPLPLTHPPVPRDEHNGVIQIYLLKRWRLCRTFGTSGMRVRQGHPSVVELNSRHGTDWRQKDKHTYWRRKKMIDEINRISQVEKRDPLEVVQSADNEQVPRGKNLNWMWEHWVKERREGRE